MKLILRLLRGTFRVLVFRLVPLALVVGIAWSGVQVAQAVMRQFDERSSYEGQVVSFAGTATALIPMDSVEIVQVVTEQSEVMPTDEVEVVEATEDVVVEPTNTEVSPSETSTTEPTQKPDPTNTEIPPSPTDEPPSPEPTNTEVPPSETPTSEPTDEPSPTLDSVTETVESGGLGQLQIFVSNTPDASDGTPVNDADSGRSSPTPTSGGSIFGDGGGNSSPTPQLVVPTTRPTLTETLEPTIVPTNTVPPTATIVPTNTAVPPTPTSAATSPPLPTVFFAAEPAEGAVSRGTAVPTSVPTVPRDYDLLNVILLGGDDGLTGDNFNRTDTMLIVSINRDTGTASMLSLPRDMFVYLPSGTMERLNVAYAVGENIGWTDGGFGLLRQTILYNFGINVHYYARVDFGGFEEIIDTLDGIDIAVDCAYQDYALIGAEVPEAATLEVSEEDGELYTLPVGYYTMSGAEALWYARTRGNSDDFDRGRRQQQIIRAIWRGVRDDGNLNITNLPTLWNQATSVVETSLTLDVIASLLPIGLDLDVNEIENFYLIRTFHTTPWQPPDGSFVQLPVYDTMRPLLEDFYRPPPESQLNTAAASIAVYDGSGIDNLDLVAADRLQWEGFAAIAYGDYEGEVSTDTILIDRSGQQRGSRLNEIAQLLNVRPENIIVEPDPNREADFEVIIGSNYDSCDAAVLDVDN